MDAKEIIVKFDKIINDVLHISTDVVFESIYRDVYKSTHFVEQANKIEVNDIYELQKNMDYYYRDLRNFDTKPRDDWNSILEQISNEKEKAKKAISILQRISDETKDEFYKIRWQFILDTFTLITNATLQHVRDTLAADQKFCEMYTRLNVDYIKKFNLQNI